MKKLTIVLLSCLLSSSLIAQNFEEITEIPFEGVSHSSIAFADVDNDNDQDVLITGSIGNGTIAKLYVNDGFGNFTEVSGSPFDGVSSSSIAFADVDNDNDQDVLITGSGISKLYTNDGNGVFTEITGTPFEGVGSSSIAFADVDNDGDQDVLITGIAIGPERISKLYTNDGNGNFTEVLDTPFKGVSNGSIAFADIENDNDKDVLITGTAGITRGGYPIAILYTNDGNGIFTEVLDTPFEEVHSSSIAFADIDSDGDQDVLITGDGDGYIAKLYTNDGNGNFDEVFNTPFEGVRNSSIAFADIDNDDDQDVLITGLIGYNVSPISKLYTNNGNGNFTEVLDTPFAGVNRSSIAFADVDNDGDQDILITGDLDSYAQEYNPSSRLYQNMTIVGINEVSLFSKVSIFPNPNKGIINIDLSSLTDVSLKVLNVSGQLIYYKENINSPIYQFELDAAPGIYFLELNAKGEKQRFKLVKN